VLELDFRAVKFLFFPRRDCYSVPTTRWCSESGEYVDVQLTTLPYDVNIGSIELEVTAIITWNRKVLNKLTIVLNLTKNETFKHVFRGMYYFMQT
jgi:hypothetical protein